MVPVASTPSIRTRPEVGSCKPATMLKIVLLPQPDGPMRLMKAPWRTARLTWSSARNAPAGVSNRMLRSSISSLAGEGMAASVPGASIGCSGGSQEACHQREASPIDPDLRGWESFYFRPHPEEPAQPASRRMAPNAAARGRPSRRVLQTLLRTRSLITAKPATIPHGGRGLAG